ncbi:MAG: hypothetical protein LKG11_01770 [Bacilli bacterium]|jgi:hypothetical protein|nr:hypothetical protein [Bacilli bacterium]
MELLAHVSKKASNYVYFVLPITRIFGKCVASLLLVVVVSAQAFHKNGSLSSLTFHGFALPSYRREEPRRPSAFWQAFFLLFYWWPKSIILLASVRTIRRLR